MAEYKIQLLVCGGQSCKSSDSQILADRLRAEIETTMASRPRTVP